MATGTDPIPWISIHALREEGDNAYVLWQRSDIDFYPRPPRGGRPAAQVTPHEMPNFYPRPPRGGRLAVLAFSALLAAISIHALREEGDRRGYRDRPDPVDFYPRPPRGGRQRLRLVAAQRHRFLSTPSARRATKLRGYGRSRRDISIHALREEGDLRFRRKTAAPIPFLSTPSARRATFPCLIVMSRPSNFYPRPPRGGRRRLQRALQCQPRFLSTPSARRATLG